MTIIVKAPAKINLVLDATAKRPDGYHDVHMVMTTVDLADRLELTELPSGEIRMNAQHAYVPNDERNLAYKAAAILKEKYDVKTGVEIFLEKHIPVAAGLAGGSSDAAATLRGLNELWQLGLTLEELAEVGAAVGSDVPFCVMGGTAIATGRGEKLEKLVSPPPCWVVLAKPTIGVSTADVYGALDLNTAKRPNVEAMIDAVKGQDFQGICQSLGNVLESVTLPMHPEVEQIKEFMASCGAEGVLMSGSGPTVFALTEHENRAQRLYNGLRGFCNEVYVVRLLGENH
ncbi:4-(cytidine 5'-diphospho)-2-C-methyl-D-erythritol kinase [Exiguobacterium sp. 22311]|uniref:4-(cytidine 5'-diphospho)-2-C-methyl-D-erythritol kinase n=1 Tax=Exiguobacterium sp. 22311 TaxID=3453907 RepID=UPI003F84A93F